MSEFEEMVSATVIRLAGLSDPEIADLLPSIAEAFEETMRRVAPQLPSAEIRQLRDVFLAAIGRRLDDIGAGSGGPVGNS